MIFKYRAVNSDGKIVTGTIEADNFRKAAGTLQQKNLNVVNLAENSGNKHSSSRKTGWNKKKAKPEELITYMHQLVTLLESGIALEEAIKSLAQSAGNQFIADDFKKISTDLRKGESFSSALGNSNLPFPGYFHTLASAGELTGKMALALGDGLQQWESDLANTNELRNALIYPVILVVSGICAVLLIFILVVPKFVNLLDKAGGDIPLLAQIVLGTGQFFNEHMMQTGVLFSVSVVLGIYLYRNEKMRRHIVNILYRLPVVGNWMSETVVGHWAAMLSTLLANKVPLLNALELAGKYVFIDSLQTGFTQVIKNVGSGSRLADSLQEMNAITPTGYNLIRSGENSGKLPQMLKALAKLCMTSSQNRIKRFLIILEPVAILCIGCVVGLIMGGIILAITSANNISF